MGADVVFDLDIHSDTKYGVYKKLDSVKDDAIRLTEDFLVSDFGISKKDIAYVFSGNRGYHIHARDSEYLNLRSDGRREMVDYIMGSGLNYNNFFDEQEIMKGVVKLTGPTPDEGGYRGRFARETIRLLHEDPTRIARKFKDSSERDNFIQGINEGNWSRTSVKDIKKRLSAVADRLSVSCVNTDAGVTQDLSKLIRVPNSIHGDTGLIAKKVEKMDSFYPLKDATAEWKGETKIRFTEDVPELEFSSTFGPFKNEEIRSLPTPIAVFFILRRSAALST
jgi:DNA primase small subunit